MLANPEPPNCPPDQTVLFRTLADFSTDYYCGVPDVVPADTSDLPTGNHAVPQLMQADPPHTQTVTPATLPAPFSEPPVVTVWVRLVTHTAV